MANKRSLNNIGWFYKVCLWISLGHSPIINRNETFEIEINEHLEA
jgi:hypothetical protein